MVLSRVIRTRWRTWVIPSLLGVALLGVLSLAGAQPASFGKAPYAILLSMDGARPDALQEVGASWLLEGASYTWKARTIFPSVTLPAHASMVTGLTPRRHGITQNRWNPGMPPIEVPTLFDYVKARGRTTAMVISKEKLGVLARPGAVDKVEVVRGRAAVVAERAIAVLTQEKPGFLFIHFSDPDVMGHLHGWMSRPYLDAVSRTAAAVGRILKTAQEEKSRSFFAVITSDHGGHGTIHGTRSPEDMTIPWIALGDQVRRGHEIRVEVQIDDTTPTILFALGIPVPASLEGKVISEIFTSP
ncbi:MAG: alkaline phosphatase family protein [Armatimonadota bacterium]|nr:alkaline phosphatase family protein [Armatimonadota bacterium]